ncbi:MAG: ribonuclease P protein component [Bacteroidota bacterium]
MSPNLNRFPKSSRLHLKSDFEGLFRSKKTVRAFPFVTHVASVPFSEVPVRIAVSVPKKRLKKAVDRNKVKRLVREVFRLNAHRFWKAESNHSETLHLLFVYQGEKPPDFSMVSDKIILTLQRLKGENESDCS